MIANYHTHTWRCNHAQPNERAYVERAIEGGLKVLGFSDHTPYPFPPEHDAFFRMDLDQFEGYVDTVLELKKEYEKDIEIHLGVEAEYYPEFFGQLQDFLRPYPVEYMILGQHYLYNEVNDAPYSGAKTYLNNILEVYVKQTIEAMKTGCFTYFAHPDLIYYVGDKDFYQQEMRKICKAAKEMNIPLEINFLGLMDHRNYPTPTFWQVVGEEGNPVIFGCDSHKPKDTWQPKAEKKAMKQYVERFGLNLIDTVEFRKPF